MCVKSDMYNVHTHGGGDGGDGGGYMCVSVLVFVRIEGGCCYAK